MVLRFWITNYLYRSFIFRSISPSILSFDTTWFDNYCLPNQYVLGLYLYQYLVIILDRPSVARQHYYTDQL